MMLDGYDKGVGELGLSTATRKGLGTLGEKVIPEFEEGAEECLAQDPVLVVGTHPGRLHSSATLAAMPERDDSFLVGHAGLEKVGPNFESHLIPMELISKNRSHTWSLIRKAIGFPKRNTPPATAKAKNQESLGRAAQIVNDGGRVLIFPDNVHKRGADSNWLPGIGRLLQQMDPNAKIVFASGNPKFKPSAALRGEHAISTKVTFSAPMEVKDFSESADKTADVDSVVDAVERQYKEWQAGLDYH